MVEQKDLYEETYRVVHAVFQTYIMIATPLAHGRRRVLGLLRTTCRVAYYETRRI